MFVKTVEILMLTAYIQASGIDEQNVTKYIADEFPKR